MHDLSFGSKGAFWNADLVGKNCLFVGTNDELVDIKRISEKIQSLINSKQPTRIVIIIPSQLLQKMDLPSRKILELASVPEAFLLTRPEETEKNEFRASEGFSIILALNQESLLIDPVHWESFKRELHSWGKKHCPLLEIAKLTDNLFNERIPLSHPPRASPTSSTPFQGVYHFFDPRTTPVAETNYLLSCGIPLEYAKVIHKINSHNRCLSMIGILPNQIRSLFPNVTGGWAPLSHVRNRKRSAREGRGAR